MSLESKSANKGNLVPAELQGRVHINAARLKSLRKQLALSQEDLAEKFTQHNIRVSLSSIKRAEAGSPMLYRIIRQLASFFNVAIDELINNHPLSQTTHSPLEVQPIEKIDLTIKRQLVIICIPTVSIPITVVKQIEKTLLQFGGQVNLANENGYLTAYFGEPKAYQNDIERAILCAQQIIHLNNHLISYIWLDLIQPHKLALLDMVEKMNTITNHTKTVSTYVYLTNNIASLASKRHLLEAVYGIESTISFYKLNTHIIDSNVLIDQSSVQTTMVGRHTETYQFKGILESVKQYLNGHIVYVRSLAGMGKTRLMMEFEQIANQNHVVPFTCEIHDGYLESWRTPFYSLTKSLLQKITHASYWSEHLISQALHQADLPLEWLTYCRILTGEAPIEQTYQAHGLPYEDSEHYCKVILCSLIKKVAAESPLLLVVEDIHWGEPPLFIFLKYLMLNTHEIPVIWMLTSRLEQDPFEDYFHDAFAHLAVSVFNLNPLKPFELAMIASQFNHVDKHYQQQCIERSNGNPLFLNQLLYHPNAFLPESLKHLIQMRLSQFNALDRYTLIIAAVLGKAFELKVLQTLIQDLQYIPTEAHRYHLLKKDDHGLYQFTHNIVMHCIYESIETDTLKAIHQRIGEYFLDKDIAACVHHFSQYNDVRLFDVLIKAIQHFLSCYQFDMAQKMCLIYCQKNRRKYLSFDFLMLQADAYTGLGQMLQAKQCYEQILQQAKITDNQIDNDQVIQATINLARVLNFLDLVDDENHLLDSILPIAYQNPSYSLIAQLNHLKASIYFLKGDHALCLSHHQEALINAKAANLIELEALALSGIGDAYYAQGKMQQANDLFSQCITLSHEHQLFRVEAANLFALGSTQFYLGQWQEAENNATKALQLADHIFHHRAKILAYLLLSWLKISRGYLADALEYVKAGLDLTRALGSLRFEVFFIESYARILFMQQQHQLANEQILWAVQQVAAHPNLQKFVGPWVMGTQALITDNPIIKQEALQKGHLYIKAGCVTHHALRFLITASEIACLDNDILTLQTYISQIIHYKSMPSCPWVDYHIQLFQHYILWLKSPTSTLAIDSLTALMHQCQQYGFCYTTPLLYTHLVDVLKLQKIGQAFQPTPIVTLT